MTNPQIDPSVPIGQIAQHVPGAVDVFERMGIEYACRGGRPLRDAATAAGVAPEGLVEALQAAARDSAAEDPGSLAELIQRIITEHHRFQDAQFRDLTAALQRLGPSEEAERIRRLLGAIAATMSTHMLREERELFPRIEELDLHPHRVRAGSVSHPLLIEFVEHDAVHEWFVKVRELVLRLRAQGADPALLDTIEEFDHAVHRHLHLENNVLIPRVLELENRLKSLHLPSA